MVGRQERWDSPYPGEGEEADNAELVEVLKDWPDSHDEKAKDYEELLEALGDES